MFRLVVATDTLILRYSLLLLLFWAREMGAGSNGNEESVTHRFESTAAVDYTSVARQVGAVLAGREPGRCGIAPGPVAGRSAFPDRGVDWRDLLGVVVAHSGTAGSAGEVGCTDRSSDG